MSYQRYWELDFFRGLNVFFMIIYHIIFDLIYFNFLNWNISSWYFQYFQKFIAISFIGVAGISLSLAHKHKSSKEIIFRGLKIYSAGLVITILTLLFIPEQFIFMGILHLIGLSIIISPLFSKFYKLNLIIGIVLIILGFIVSSITVHSKILLLLGFPYEGFRTLDYFPIFPWFGVFLIGLFIGKLLYEKIMLTIPQINSKLSFAFQKVSRKSLLVYLLHQPIIIIILYIVKEIK